MFLPLRDENTSGKFPAVNILLILANLAVFFYQLTLPPGLEKAFVMANAMIPARIPTALAGHGSLEAALLTLVTSMFLHAGFAHILGNMLFLWIFGDNVEARFGHLGYLLFFFVCGIGAGLTHILFNLNSHLPAVGASGAISGVLGAYIVLEPHNRILTLIFIFVVRIPAIVVLGLWFVMQFLMGLGTIGTAANVTGGVAVWAHIGGFLIGLAIALGVKHK
jgi:membrane associated rhomboid family serine protease